MIEHKAIKLKLFHRGGGKEGKKKLIHLVEPKAINLMVVEITGTFWLKGS